jgi:hypothetical protein
VHRLGDAPHQAAHRSSSRQREHEGRGSCRCRPSQCRRYWPGSPALMGLPALGLADRPRPAPSSISSR